MDEQLMRRLLLLLALLPACALAQAQILPGILGGSIAAGGGGDPYFSSVKLLLGNDNAASGTTATTVGNASIDQEATPKTITASATAPLYSNTTAPTGMTTSINCLSASTEYMRTAASADFNPGTGAWVLQWKVYLSADGTQTLVDFRNSSSSDAAVNIREDGYAGNWNITVAIGTTDVIASSNVSTRAGAWHDITLAEDASRNMRLYYDGTQLGSTYADSTTYINGRPTICANRGGTGNVNGYISNVRWTNGTDRGFNGATITPSTVPMPTN